MAAVAAAALGGLFYLITRIQKFAWIGYLAKGRKKRRFLISAALCVAVTVFLGWLWGTINAMICVIHLLVFFLLSEGITAIYEKCRRRTVCIMCSAITIRAITRMNTGATEKRNW